MTLPLNLVSLFISLFSFVYLIIFLWWFSMLCVLCILITRAFYAIFMPFQSCKIFQLIYHLLFTISMLLFTLLGDWKTVKWLPKPYAYKAYVSYTGTSLIQTKNFSNNWNFKILTSAFGWPWPMCAIKKTWTAERLDPSTLLFVFAFLYLCMLRHFICMCL